MNNENRDEVPHGSVSMLPAVAKNAKLVELLDNGQDRNYTTRHDIVALIRTFERRNLGRWDSQGREQFVYDERVWALVAQSDNERIAVLEGERDRANKAAADAAHKLLDEKKTLERDAKEFANLKELCEAYKKDVDSARGNNVRLVEQNKKLEGDIAKLRKALGELRMKEIIG